MMLGHHGKDPTLPGAKSTAGPTRQTSRTDTDSMECRRIVTDVQGVRGKAMQRPAMRPMGAGGGGRHRQAASRSGRPIGVRPEIVPLE